MLQVLHHGESKSIPWVFVEIVWFIKDKRGSNWRTKKHFATIKYVLYSFHQGKYRPEIALNEGPLLMGFYCQLNRR